jgi:hypothetical protein
MLPFRLTSLILAHNLRPEKGINRLHRNLRQTGALSIFNASSRAKLPAAVKSL